MSYPTTLPHAPDHLPSRARDLLERAERMQDLHGQAQAQLVAHHTRLPAAGSAANGSLDPAQLLPQSARAAIHDTHLALQEAAEQARQMAQGDPVLARLNARIHGVVPPAAPTADVIDVEATEPVPGRTAGALPPPQPDDANPERGT
jgi:hypothetical protein